MLLHFVCQRFFTLAPTNQELIERPVSPFVQTPKAHPHYYKLFAPLCHNNWTCSRPLLFLQHFETRSGSNFVWPIVVQGYELEYSCRLGCSIVGTRRQLPKSGYLLNIRVNLDTHCVSIIDTVLTMGVVEASFAWLVYGFSWGLRWFLLLVVLIFPIRGR